jgi:hypothetical protein
MSTSTYLLRNWLKYLVAMILLTVGNPAYAQDVQRRSGAAEPDHDRTPRQSTVLGGRVPVGGQGLAFPLRTTGAPVWIEAELRLDGKVIMSDQQIASPGARVVHLFGAGQLGALRDQDARNPGRVQLRILQAGKPVFDSSLTKFDAQYAADRPRSGRRPRNVAAKSACTDDCDNQLYDCSTWCDPRGAGVECNACHDQYNNCIASCPTCNDWVEVSRTRIGRRYSGSANILGAQYCHFEEYYLVEQANAAGCYPNRTLCDYDNDTIFLGFGSYIPSEPDCCDNDPNDEFYCGGDTTTC